MPIPTSSRKGRTDQTLGNTLTGGTLNHNLQRNNGKDGPDGVDEDPFGPKDRLQGPVHSNPPKEGGDDGWARDDHQRSEEDRHAPVPSEEKMGRQSPAQKGDSGPQCDETPNGKGLPAEAPDVEIQSPFKQDHGHGKPDYIVFGMTQGGRVHDSQQLGAQKHTCGQEEDDPRDLQMVGENLGRYPCGQGQRENESRAVGWVEKHGDILRQISPLAYGDPYRGGTSRQKEAGVTPPASNGSGLCPDGSGTCLGLCRIRE
jgi:nucleoid-associated protein YgaU